MTKQRIWIVDDEEGICTALYFTLKSSFEVRTFQTSAPMLEQLQRESCDVILLDLKLGEEDGLDVLHHLKQEHPGIEVIIMTAYASIGTSVKAMKEGAFTYLTKPLDIEELKIVLQQAFEFRMLSRKVSDLSDELEYRRHFDRIIGESSRMQQVYRMINTLKDIDSNVLITGESGTGKELVAKAIHGEGKRKDERFVVVNCAAIPENLLESEFFGHKRGSFTGADTDRKGKFELADRGTIFLDEIGDMPLALQAKILRVLQDKEFTPVGAGEPRKVDVRVIAATNRDLRALIAEKKFREDLYYRLNVMSIEMPPLRMRGDDILLLCDNFIQRNAFEMKKTITGLTREAKDILTKYSYPGNVRQLANILEYACIVCGGGLIGPEHLPREVREESAYNPIEPVASDLSRFLSSHSLKEIEKLAIAETLKKNKGRRDKTAEDLGISKRGLLNKTNEYGLS